MIPMEQIIKELEAKEVYTTPISIYRTTDMYIKAHITADENGVKKYRGDTRWLKLYQEVAEFLMQEYYRVTTKLKSSPSHDVGVSRANQLGGDA